MFFIKLHFKDTNEQILHQFLFNHQKYKFIIKSLTFLVEFDDMCVISLKPWLKYSEDSLRPHNEINLLQIQTPIHRLIHKSYQILNSISKCTEKGFRLTIFISDYKTSFSVQKINFVICVNCHIVCCIRKLFIILFIQVTFFLIVS